MGDGHETESAVERLLADWRKHGKFLDARSAISMSSFTQGDSYRMNLCIDALQAALEEDGVIPTRK